MAIDVSGLGAIPIEAPTDISGLGAVPIQEGIGTEAEELAKRLGMALGGVGEQFGRGVGAFGAQAANLLNPQLRALAAGVQKTLPWMPSPPQQLLGQVPVPQAPSGVIGRGAYQAGQAAPLLTTGIGEAEAIGAPIMRGVEEAVPAIGRAAEEVPTLARQLYRSLLARPTTAAARTAGMGAYGAIMSPQDRLRGALTGAMYGMGGEVAAPVMGAVGRGITWPLRAVSKALGPQQYSEKLLETMGNAKGVPIQQRMENNAKSLASDIKDSFSRKKAQANNMYSQVTDKVKDDNIYKEDIPERGYISTPAKVTETYTGNLSKANDDFLRKPTFENAHKLQNVLGVESAKPYTDTVGREKAEGYYNARQALKSDMDTYLRKNYPGTNLANQYQNASDFYRDQVVPYKASKKIRQISTGEITNPKAINTVFANPEPTEADKAEGFLIRDVMNNIGQDAKHKVVYSELGKLEGKLTPEKLINAYNNLGNKGLGSYITPDMQEQMSALQSKVRMKNIAKMLPSLGLGYFLVPRHYGGAAELGGALGGAALTPNLLRAFRTSAGRTIPRTTKRAISPYYRLLSQALLAQQAGGQ
jgi:hypothetical protein